MGTEGQNDGRTDRMTESQKLCPSAFLRKGGGQRTEGQKDGRNDGKPKTMSLRFSSKRRGTKTQRTLRREKTGVRGSRPGLTQTVQSQKQATSYDFGFT